MDKGTAIEFENAESLVEFLRAEEQPNYVQFQGDGEFGQAWVAWENGMLCFTSESGLRLQHHSAFLFAQKCLNSDAYSISPVSRSAVAYLDELVG